MSFGWIPDLRAGLEAVSATAGCAIPLVALAIAGFGTWLQWRWPPTDEDVQAAILRATAGL